MFLRPGGGSFEEISVTTSWQKLFPASGENASTAFNFDIAAKNGSGGTSVEKTVFVWGGQLGVGAFPTSYIKTEGSSVARSADVDSADISAQLGAENTLFVSARTGLDAGVVCQIDDGTENERYRIERNSSNELRLFVTDGGVEQVGASGLNLGTVADETDFKLAIRLAANDFAASLDGAAVVTDTSGSLPTVDTIRFGMDTANDEWNSTIAEGKLFNVGKDDAFLRSLAT